MPAFYRAKLIEFLQVSESELTGRLSVEYARSGFSSQRASQTMAWISDIVRLQNTLQEFVDREKSAGEWTLLLEFPIPRKEKRIDVVMLAIGAIVLLELKSGSAGIEAIRQTEEYCLLLHYFHRPSDRRKIFSFVIANNQSSYRPSKQQFLPLAEAPGYWIEPVEQIGWGDLVSKLTGLSHLPGQTEIDPNDWDHGEYFPVPSIIDAARSLQNGLRVSDIAQARASRHDVDQMTHYVSKIVRNARENREFAICFVTGVPGSGKTLVGLSLAFSTLAGDDPIHFMSGNGPLVKVLKAVFERNHRATHNVRAHEARIHAATLIENIHVFATEYAERKTDLPPSNHVIVFDEAQRAWNREQNKAKFKRDYSEPEMILRIMERHREWAVIIALVGGGQEINSGEAGLQEWGHSLSCAEKSWKIYASPEAIRGGSSVAGTRLVEDDSVEFANIYSEPKLHLDVTIRSLKADAYARWVNHVVRGEAELAKAINIADSFPVYLTRSLSDARNALHQHALGDSRCGLVASSRALRLRAEGLEPDTQFHGNYPWEHWYLAPPTDLRSSQRLEVFATEFEIQGLELDWIGLCWGGDAIWSEDTGGWLFRKLHVGTRSKWSLIRSEVQREYRRNSYRVLLTRARQGIVIYLPMGDPDDSTRSPNEFDATANFLLRCGARLLH